MDIRFSPDAALQWQGLDDLEQMRVEIALRGVSLQHLTTDGGEFSLHTYDLLAEGRVTAGGLPVFVQTLKRITQDPLQSRRPQKK
jgi:hypothetical protein